MARMVKYDMRGGFPQPTEATLNGLETAIRWAEIEVPGKLRSKMDLLTRLMALINQGEARSMSFGPHDPFQKNTNQAWRIPVRRITEGYYLGWKVHRVGAAHYILYNDSREAYFIEFGISEVGWGTNRHVPARRIRRPIRKMSLRRTVEIMLRTRVYHRVWADIFSDPKYKNRGKGFSQIMQSPGTDPTRSAITSAGILPIAIGRVDVM